MRIKKGRGFFGSWTFLKTVESILEPDFSDEEYENDPVLRKIKRRLYLLAYEKKYNLPRVQRRWKDSYSVFLEKNGPLSTLDIAAEYSPSATSPDERLPTVRFEKACSRTPVRKIRKRRRHKRKRTLR